MQNQRLSKMLQGSDDVCSSPQKENICKPINIEGIQCKNEDTWGMEGVEVAVRMSPIGSGLEHRAELQLEALLGEVARAGFEIKCLSSLPVCELLLSSLLPPWCLPRLLAKTDSDFSRTEEPN